MGDSNHDPDDVGQKLAERSAPGARRPRAKEGAVPSPAPIDQLEELEPVDDEDDDDDDDDEVDAEAEADAEAGGATENAPEARNGAARRRRRRSRDSAAPSNVPMDERSEQAFRFTNELLKKMLMDVSVRLSPPSEDSGDINLQITGPDAGRIIGKKGQVLAAVQFIVNRAMNRPGIERRYITVDADGYRSRRESSLANMARRLGKQAVSDGKIITFEPMSPRDRRVVHLALAKFEGVVTRSEGEGDDRRVQIIPVRRG
jgi:spoIIIJ-associated protein